MQGHLGGLCCYFVLHAVSILRRAVDVLFDRVRCALAYQLHISSCVLASRFLFSPSSPAQKRGIEGVRRDRKRLAKGDQVQSLTSRF